MTLFVGCGKKDDSITDKAGETLVLLKSGGNGNVSYGLFHAVTRSRARAFADCDLILVLRDYGAKFVYMSEVTSHDFSIQDSRGTNITFTLATHPETLTLGKSTVIHLRVEPSVENTQPWTLRFKAKGAEYVTDLRLTDIRW
jgi:hypothetical protein